MFANFQLNNIEQDILIYLYNKSDHYFAITVLSYR